MSRVLRAAFVDLDDTFLAPDKSIPQPNLDLMDELERRGIELVPCTGRHVGGVPRAMLDHPCVHHVVASNGGIVHDLDTHTDLRVVGIDHQQILSLYDDLALNHMDFANGVCNERIKWKKALSNGKTEYSWISKEPHDFLDCLAMCRAIAESEGLSATMPHRVSQTSHTPHTVQAVQATATPIAASPSRISLLRRKMALSRKRVRII